MTLDEAMQLAVSHHQAGRLASAEALYRQILAAQPRNAAVMQMMGVLALQTGHHEIAIKLLRDSIAIDPNIPQAHCNLGLALHAHDQEEEAIASFRRAIQVKPAYPEALNNLGNALNGQQKNAEAIECYRRALAFRPDYPEALNNLGNALQKDGLSEEAVEYYQRALAIYPNYAEARSNLGVALQARGELSAGIVEMRAAVELDPNKTNFRENLEVALKAERYTGQSLESLQRQVEENRSSDTLVCLALALEKDNRLGEALNAFQQAAELEPDTLPPMRGLTTVLLRMGLIPDAIEYNRKIVELDPTDAGAQANLLYALHHDPNISPKEMFEQHRRWNDLFAKPLKEKIIPPANNRLTNRPLRIGYVSPDFHQHSVFYFLMPLLQNHDRKQFHITCYSTNAIKDHVTEQFRSTCDRWRNLAALNDDDAAALIRRDEIDILIDLAGHTAGGRLPIFAQKPAPVQIEYLGYFNTSGLDTMDYWITDIHNDPPGQTEPFCSEKLFRLPNTFACYRPPENAPEISPIPPAAASGYVTFGSFNKLSKLNDQVLSLWSQVLSATPNSKLLIQAKGLGDSLTRERLTARLIAQQISPDRVELIASQPMDEHLKTITERADIYLDPFPFTGHTVTLHTLWMGLPFVTLAGNTHVGRRGIGLLTNLGLKELIAADWPDYVRITAELARDIPRITELRNSMRSRLRQSPLMDERGFAKNMEAAYCQMWAEWCGAI